MRETLEEILPRMLADRWRVEAGQRRLDRMVRNGELTGPVAAALLDLDGSGAVRARGIEAKIRLVQQVRRLVSGLLPAAAITTDSGTRDELYIVLPGAGAPAVTALAERIRAAVAATAFPIDGPHDTVRLTTSVGVAALNAPASGGEVFEAVRDALHEAKKTRDCVRLLDRPQRVPVTVSCPRPVAEALARYGVHPDVALRTGLWSLQEKHGPVWHYVAGVAGADQGRLPVLPPVPVPDGTDPGMVAFFELMVGSVALEAAVGHRAAAPGYRCLIRARHGAAPGGELVARYLPGEWVSCTATADGAVLAANDVCDAIQDARAGDSRRVPVSASVGSSALAALAKARQARGRDTDQLLREALQLGVDAVRAWEAAGVGG